MIAKIFCREVVTFALLVWVVLALFEPVFSHQGMREIATVAGSAGRGLSHWGARGALAFVLIWGLIPQGGGGK